MDLEDLASQFKDMETNGSNRNENLVSFTSESTVDEYNRRMKGIFQDMFDLGYI